MADITQRGMLKLPLPTEGEVIERSSFLPFGLYQTPEGTKHIDFAWPAPIKKGMDIAHDSMFGPSAKPEYTPIQGADGSTYVSQEDLNEGGAAIAGLAAQGSLLARGAPTKGMMVPTSKPVLDQAWHNKVIKTGELFANPSTASIMAMLDTLKQQDDKGRGLLAPMQ